MSIPDKIELSYKELTKEIERLEALTREKYDIARGGLLLGKKAALLEICKNHVLKHEPKVAKLLSPPTCSVKVTGCNCLTEK